MRTQLEALIHKCSVLTRQNKDADEPLQVSLLLIAFLPFLQVLYEVCLAGRTERALHKLFLEGIEFIDGPSLDFLHNFVAQVRVHIAYPFLLLNSRKRIDLQRQGVASLQERLLLLLKGFNLGGYDLDYVLEGSVGMLPQNLVQLQTQFKPGRLGIREGERVVLDWKEVCNQGQVAE